MKRFISLSLLICTILGVFQTKTNAQPSKQLITIMVTPDRANWTYKTGEQVNFKISVFRNDFPIENIKIEYTIRPEKMEVIKREEIILKDGKAFVEGGTMTVPGFLNCFVKVVYDEKTYNKYATAGFDVGKIAPTTTLPSDFTNFWNQWKAELAQIPVNPTMTLMPELCTDKVDVYHVSIQNIEGKIYGILCKPKAEGKYPAILHVPGAGVRPYFGDIDGAEKGFITFQIGIHGIPVNLEPKVYADLKSGALLNYRSALMDDKDNYYYKRVYLGCVRSVDFLCNLLYYDGENIAVTGGSQGGALSIVTAGLDTRIKCLAALYPALSDLTGYIYGRAGGWPHMFTTGEKQHQARIETSKYYDVVNFARFVKVPGWYSWGYNDNVCPPTSTYAAYNIITAPKELHLFQDTQHWRYPEQQEMLSNWLYAQLKK